MKKRQHIKGFTLVELMVTIAIMGIMAAIAMPNLTSFINQSRINNRAEQIGNLFRYAKGEAIRMNIPVVICGDTIRSDGRPAGDCTDTIFDTGAKAAQSGLKAFADANQDGIYKSNNNSEPADIDLRTISINGNSNNQYIEMELKQCGIGSNVNCNTDVAAPKQMVFFPSGQFGIQKNANDLRGILTGSQYVRFIIKDAKKADDKARWRYVVISPTGNVGVCSEGGKNNSNGLCNL